MSERIYFDTSALAKWYIRETDSEEVEAFILAHGPVYISSLTAVEMRSLLARRRRNNDISAEIEMQIFSTFNEDIREGHLIEYPISEEITAIAIYIVSVLLRPSIRTLDALHLALCKQNSLDKFATADQVMMEAGEVLGLQVIKFEKSSEL